MTDVIVSLCVNDDHGGPTGHVERADFNDAGEHVETLLELESQWWYDEEEDEANPHPTFEERPGEIVIDGMSFPTIGRREHVGNVYWNGYRMTVENARKLAVDLRALGWQTMCWTEGNPLLTHDLCGWGK